MDTRSPSNSSLPAASSNKELLLSAEFEPVSLPDERLSEIVRQVTDAQELSDLQADIFGSSAAAAAAAEHHYGTALTLPAFLEGASAAASASAAAADHTRKRKLSPPSASKKHQQQQHQHQQHQPGAFVDAFESPSPKRQRAATAPHDAPAAPGLPPPLPPYVPGLSSDGAAGGASSKLNHNRSERQRRQKVNDSIEELRVLLPPQCREVAGNKLAILQESVGYMRHLKSSLEHVQAERAAAADAYRRLYDEYCSLRHYLNTYLPKMTHVAHAPLPLPPSMPYLPLPQQSPHATHLQPPPPPPSPAPYGMAYGMMAPPPPPTAPMHHHHLPPTAPTSYPPPPTQHSLSALYAHHPASADRAHTL